MTTQKKITIGDVAANAGVSKSTVSQFLNERFEYMGTETKARIENSIQELGFSPNFVARSLKQKKTFTIGVIVANILHNFSTQVIRAIEDRCNERNVHVIVCNADNEAEKEEKYIKMLSAKQVDGFIIFPTGKNIELYQQLKERLVPVIFIDRIIQGVDIPTVLLDNEKAADMAVEHFVKLGHSKIAIAAPALEEGITPRVERAGGFEKAMQARGLNVPKEYFLTKEITELKNELHDLYQSDNKPTALFAMNDLTLMEVLNFCKEAKLSLPKDLSIVCIDDVMFAHLYSPELTTIKQPGFDIGKKGADLLLEQMENPSALDSTYRFEPEFIERNSVAQL